MKRDILKQKSNDISGGLFAEDANTEECESDYWSADTTELIKQNEEQMKYYAPF